MCLSWPIPCITWHCAVAPRRLWHTYGSGSIAITFLFGRRNSALRVARCQPQFGAQVAKGRVSVHYVSCAAKEPSRVPTTCWHGVYDRQFRLARRFSKFNSFSAMCPERSLNRTCTADATALTARGLHDCDDRKVVFQICEN